MTIVDIARLAGVSKSTVSRYLTGGGVSPQTAEKIARVVEETGFVLNASASKLRSQRSHLIGVLIDGIGRRETVRQIRGMDVVLHERGYLPLIVIDEHDASHGLADLQAFVQQGVDAVIFGAARLTKERASFMKDAGVPALVLGQRSDLFPFAKVDDYAGGRTVAEHVIVRRPRHIVFLSLSGNGQASRERWQGFADTCGSAGMDVELIMGGHGPSERRQLAADVLSSGADFVVGASDRLCLDLMSALAERGMSSPADLRMAGFGNYAESRLPMVSLTSLDYDYATLGRRAASLAIDLAEGRDIPRETTDIPMGLHIRASSGA